MEDNRSDVQKFYDAVAVKFGTARKFEELSPQQVMMLCHGINMILEVYREPVH